MSFELRDESGSLFINDRKQKENHPDYKGSCKINGVEYWISGWKKQGARGTFLSLAFQQKDGGFEETPTQSKKPAPPMPSEFDDDIPF